MHTNTSGDVNIKIYATTSIGMNTITSTYKTTLVPTSMPYNTRWYLFQECRNAGGGGEGRGGGWVITPCPSICITKYVPMCIHIC